MFIDQLDDEVLVYTLLKHVVSPLMNPTPQPLRIKEEYKMHIQESAWSAMEKFSSHHGQRVTIATCTPADFKCSSDFNKPNLDSKFAASSMHSYSNRVENTQFLKKTLFALPTNGDVGAPLVRSKDHFGIADGEDDETTFAKIENRVLGVRYRKDSVLTVNRIISSTMLVCKLWHRILAPYTVRLAIANVKEPPHFSELKAQVENSTALRGMPALDIHMLGRNVKSLIYAARKYAFVDENNELRSRTQSFPANLVLCNSMYVRLRLGAVDDDNNDDNDDPAGTKLACMHAPRLVASFFKTGSDPRHHDHFRCALDVKSALVKFAFKKQPQYAIVTSANAPLVSGMFFVDTCQMVALDWTPTASSYSFRSFSRKPLTPLRLLLYTGTTEDAVDNVCMSDDFYVMSRKSNQVSVNNAASNRRLVSKS